MPTIFTAVDPEGFEVICTDSQWADHVIHGHKELKGKEAKVKEAIEQPDAIYQDSKHKDRRVYYRKQSNKNFYIKVVIKFVGKKGEVITAFLADKPKAGEIKLWNR